MPEFVIGIISFVLTVMIFSYLLGDNFFFRLAVYLLVGVSSGYTAGLIITKVLIPYLILPLWQGPWEMKLFLLVPLVLCILLLIMLFPRLVHAGSIPLAFLVGIVSALTIAGVTLGTLLPQIFGTIAHFEPTILFVSEGQTWLKILDVTILLIGVVATLFYFHFGLSNKAVSDQGRPKLIEGFGKLGQVFVGITLGALFAGVYSAALLALISRIAEIRNFFIMLFGM